MLRFQPEKDISFEVVFQAISEGKILDVIDHPNPDKYPFQQIFIIEINQYIYLVPFVESDQEIFLNHELPKQNLKRLEFLAQEMKSSIPKLMVNIIRQYLKQSPLYL